MFLPGEISLYARKGDDGNARRSEKSAEAEVVATKPAAEPKPRDAGTLRHREGPNEKESESTMNLDGKRPQMSARAELGHEKRGEASPIMRSEEASSAKKGPEHSGASGIMELVVEKGNVVAALKRVEQNKGGAGADGMSTQELRAHLREHWPRIRGELLAGTYHPTPVRRVSIPKSSGGFRELGIPTVLDRFIQQALLQVLQPRIDPTFSSHSHGYRPGRSTHGALREALGHVKTGRQVVVDVDLSKFFDRVNHDVLMSRVARHVADGRALRLIRRYLECGVMANGVVIERNEGTMQGGPLSPLLANTLLDEVDKELERRGHAFVRYADDLNVYVRSRKAGERVFTMLRSLYEGLHLRINEDKSAVADVTERKFLGFTFSRAWRGIMRLRPSAISVERMKDRIRELTRPTRGRNLKQVAADLRRYLPGWKTYFGFAESSSKTLFRELDGWIRRRLRAFQLRQWRNPKLLYRELIRLGADAFEATCIARSPRSYWANAHTTALHVTLSTRFFDRLGVPKLGGA